jgi:hypothetical protein
MDSGGLSGAVWADYLPATSTVAIASDPAGLVVYVSGDALQTPTSAQIITGTAVNVSAEPFQILNGLAYSFVSWSDAPPGADSSFNAHALSGLTAIATFARNRECRRGLSVPPSPPSSD